MGRSFEEKSTWLPPTGMLTALGAYFVVAGRRMFAGVHDGWIAHLLLASLFASHVLACTLQLVYYRRGIRGWPARRSETGSASCDSIATR